VLLEASCFPRQLHDALTASATAGMASYSQASEHSAKAVLHSDCEGSGTKTRT
jgi:hypothetical protein